MNSDPLKLLMLCTPLVLLAGCAANIADRGWQPMRPLGKDLATMRPALDAKAAAAREPAIAEEPDGSLTLRQALTLAMLHSPDLAGASWEVRASEARALQAILPPNPGIGLDVESIASPRIVESVLSVGQLIFLSDKLSRQKKVALLDRDMAGWEWEAQRIRVYTDTTRAFIALVAAQERLALAEENVEVSQKLLDVAAERVHSGKAAPLEEMKAKVELGTVRADLAQAKQTVLTARQRLAAMWGGMRPKFAKAEGKLDIKSNVPTTDQLFALIAQNTEVARWATEMERREAVVVLERRKAIPDLTIGGGYKRESASGEPTLRGFTVGGSIPVPIFDRNQGGIKESRYNVAKGREEQRATKARVLTELAEAYRSMASAHARSVILGKEVVPEAQKAFDAAVAGYDEGKFAYLDVLDAQRTVFDARIQQNEALAEHLAATADVEGLIGQSIDSLSQTNATTQRATTQKSQEK